MAVSLTIEQVMMSVETDLSDEALTRLIGVASATIERRAAAAPEAVQNEAAIRMIGYLVAQPKSAQRMESVGEYRIVNMPTLNSAWHWSGAESLCAPWMVHRAGLITVGADESSDSEDRWVFVWK